MEQGSKRRLGIIYVILTALCFGTNEVALRISGASFGAAQLCFMRFLIGGLVLLPFAIREGKKRTCRLNKSDWLYLMLLGGLNIGISMPFYQIGIMKAGAGISSVIVSTNPIFTMLCAAILWKEKLGAKKIAVSVISIAGLLIILMPQKGMAGDEIGAYLALVASAAVFGVYSAVGKLRVNKIGNFTQNSYSFLFGSAIQLVMLLVQKKPVLEGLDWNSLPALLYSGIVVTALGYFFYLKAIDLIGPVNSSIAFYIKPIIGVSAATLVFQEKIVSQRLIGMGLVLGAFLLDVLVSDRKKVDNR